MEESIGLVVMIRDVDLPEIGYFGEGCRPNDDCPFDECGCGGGDQY